MKHRMIGILTATTITLTTLGIAGGAPASAKDGDVVVRGDCSARSDYKLKLQPRGRQIEYEFEVDSNVNGQRWTVRITDNGSAVFRGARRTQPPSGSFTVERRTANRAGLDRFVARATNPATGERCIARARV